MAEKKQIKINVADFNNFNTTRKKKTKDKAADSPGIKIKTPTSKPKMDTLRKRSLLKMIRQQQEDRYNKLFNASDGKSSSAPKETVPEITEMNTELEKAKEYLNNLKEKQEQNKKTAFHNTTIKHNPQIQSILPSANIAALPMNNVRPQPSSTVPLYGCLRNGSLPTYKTFMRTSRNQPIIQIGNPVPLKPNPPTQPDIQSMPIRMPDIQSVPNPVVTNIMPVANIIDTKLNESIKRMAELKQSEIILKREQNKHRPKRMMQKKTVRRTYKIGRSTALPKIAVLVSNKTIRNSTTTKSQLLKQIPMNEIKRHLIKRGLIRVGSTTPNDVLRKMYESTMLMCGDVQNHNADNLLYNFLNEENTP